MKFFRTWQAKYLFLLVMCLINIEKNICTDVTCQEEYAFHCDSKDQCILLEEQCDGQRNCRDGSDETVENCIQNREKCQHYTFACTYGACIKDGLQCNGKEDCADGSDEALAICNPKELAKKIQGSCGDLKMQCNSGDCIDFDDTCDGKRDCVDGSDESLTLCLGRKCPPLSFQCGYGACVSATARCNNIAECEDGSDEIPSLCPSTVNRTLVWTVPSETSSTTTTTRSPFTSLNLSSCIVIYSSDNIIIKDAVRKNVVANGGMIYVNGAVNFECKPGHTRKGSPQSRCKVGGIWASEFPVCLKYCSEKHPKSGFSTVATFLFNGNDVTSLNKFEPTTVGTISCAQGYRKPSHFEKTLTCEPNGLWNPYKQKCIMECGRPSVPIQEYSSGGMKVNVTQVPWHVGLYNQTGTTYTNICGGTIISPHHVISAAHCFFDSQKPFTGIQVDPKSFKIAAGKFYREYDSPNEPIRQLIQKRDISDVWIHPDYTGKDGGFYRDISIITLARFLVFSDMVRPICLDFPQEHLRSIPTGVEGHFSAYSQLTIRDVSSLQKLKMSTVSHDECESELKKGPSSTIAHLAGDKFCLASYNDNYACRGDSGNGFAIYNTRTDQYFLRGIISFSPSQTQECSVNTLLVLTNVLYYETFLTNYRDTDLHNDVVVS